jgi:hypothetical protein
MCYPAPHVELSSRVRSAGCRLFAVNLLTRRRALLDAGRENDKAGAEMIFTSKRQHTLSQALMPFFGGRVPA